MTAANEAFEADLDLVVALGWAHIESHAYKTLLGEAEAASQALQAPLQLLASLYGLSRLERSMAHYLAAGVVQGWLQTFAFYHILGPCCVDNIHVYLKDVVFTWKLPCRATALQLLSLAPEVLRCVLPLCCIYIVCMATCQCG